MMVRIEFKGWEQISVLGCCENGNEPSAPVVAGKYVDQLKDY
jgi:hypothetical protein